MNKDSIRKNPWHSRKKSVFRLILGGKICILPIFKVKKSVYTDKISMSGKSVNDTCTTSFVLKEARAVIKAGTKKFSACWYSMLFVSSLHVLYRARD